MTWSIKVRYKMITEQNNVCIELASKEHQTVLKNLHQFYLHDLSEYTINLNTTPDGLFDNNDVDFYYEKENLYPYLIIVGDEIIGFIFFNLPPNAPDGYHYYISDLFILKKHRHKGYARQAVEHLLDLRQGKYALLELSKNSPAIEFWHRFFEMNQLRYSEVEMIVDEETCLFQGFEII